MSKSKKCFKCGEIKLLTTFYKHPQMADGRVNKCKECNKADVIKNRLDNIEYYRDYDKRRSHLPHRLKLRDSNDDAVLYSHIPKNHPSHSPITSGKAWVMRNRIKRGASAIVGNAVRCGKIERLPCEICGSEERIHGHHDDYAHPLMVRWLCPKHHRAWHNKNGEGLNGH